MNLLCVIIGHKTEMFWNTTKQMLHKYCSRCGKDWWPKFKESKLRIEE